MELIKLPRGFLRFSLSVFAVLVLSWWVDLELIPVASGTNGWPPIVVLFFLARFGLWLSFTLGSVGVGLGCGLLGVKCFRAPRRIKSGLVIVRYALSTASAGLAFLVMMTTLSICMASMNSLNLLCVSVLFGGLQVSELLLWRRILRWRYFRQKVSL